MLKQKQLQVRFVKHWYPSKGVIVFVEGRYAGQEYQNIDIIFKNSLPKEVLKIKEPFLFRKWRYSYWRYKVWKKLVELRFKVKSVLENQGESVRWCEEISMFGKDSWS